MTTKANLYRCHHNGSWHVQWNSNRPRRKFLPQSENPNGKITITYIGFNPQTLTAASNMQITMKSEDKELNEVVVVGYGTQKKVNLTGSVSSVDSKALESRPIQNVQSGTPGHDAWCYHQRYQWCSWYGLR